MASCTSLASKGFKKPQSCELKDERDHQLTPSKPWGVGGLEIGAAKLTVIPYMTILPPQFLKKVMIISLFFYF